MSRVLVTGAGRGIGLEFVRQLLARGDTVYATVRDRSRAEALTALGGPLTVLDLDAGDPASIQALGDMLADYTPSLDLLIASAGISSGSRDFTARAPASHLRELDAATLQKLFAVNATGPLVLAQRLLPLLACGHEPRILFISTQLASITNKTGGGNYGYGASKAALNMFARTLANDLRQEQSPILVAPMHPGWVKTDMGGPQAPLTPSDSVRGMLSWLARMRPDDSGRFVDWEGAPLPW